MDAPKRIRIVHQPVKLLESKVVHMNGNSHKGKGMEEMLKKIHKNPQSVQKAPESQQNTSIQSESSFMYSSKENEIAKEIQNHTIVNPSKKNVDELLLRLSGVPSFEDRLHGYVYVIDNGLNIKIGLTTNLAQRIQSLSNSNGGGQNIVRICYSPACAIYTTLENRMHTIYHNCNTVGEWFSGISFEEVCQTLYTICLSHEFQLCDKVRNQAYETPCVREMIAPKGSRRPIDTNDKMTRECEEDYDYNSISAYVKNGENLYDSKVQNRKQRKGEVERE